MNITKLSFFTRLVQIKIQWSKMQEFSFKSMIFRVLHFLPAVHGHGPLLSAASDSSRSGNHYITIETCVPNTMTRENCPKPIKSVDLIFELRCSASCQETPMIFVLRWPRPKQPQLSGERLVGYEAEL